jgi:RNA polymerase sigma-70 factor (ECF subfamily)
MHASVLPRNPAPPMPVGMAGRAAASDEALISVATGGDLRAWETLVRRYQGFAFRCAYLTTRDPQMAEDATRDGFVRAYRALSSMQEATPFRPWLMRVVAGVARSRKRAVAQQRDGRYVEPQRAHRLRAEPLMVASSMVTPTPLEHEALSGAFDRLGDTDREIVASRYALGLTRSEMAIYLGIPEQDVDDRLRASLRRLRHYLGGA